MFSENRSLCFTVSFTEHPLIFTGLSVAFSFRTGIFNIGAEGQFVMGSLAAVVVGILFPLPTPLHVLLCLVVAALAGAFLGLFGRPSQSEKGGSMRCFPILCLTGLLFIFPTMW